MHTKPIYVAVIWNQHQPFYLEPDKNEFIMPWVRLHAVKDYYQMAALLRRYPKIQQTINLTPSLLEQITAYLEKGAVDSYLKVMKPISKLTRDDKIFLLSHYFDIHWERVIGDCSYYCQLLERQGRVTEPGSVESALNRFTEQDYLDLQVWFNLAWIDPEIREKDPFLLGLVEKGRNFNENDKQELMNKQRFLMEQIIPLHRELMQAGQIELITTPYYHPIIPLLIDNHTALRASPGMAMPERFQYPQDACEQTGRAVEQFRSYFGSDPIGIWPPEQAVSQESIPVFADRGFRWFISDEQILAHSLDSQIYRDGYGHVLNPELLYQPYAVAGEGAELTAVFRDHHLSDRIGFEYQNWRADDAAGDFIHRLHKIRESLQETDGNHLVTVALDGENAWEWYQGDKKFFLNHLYSRLSDDPLIQTVTVSGYIKANPPRRKINRLHTGSWVDHSLARWIGTDNKNTFWNYLMDARRALTDFGNREGKDNSRYQRAYNYLLMSEGSDYTWWVDSMPYYLAEPFDALYRRHLAGVYRSLGILPPAYLDRSSLQPEGNMEPRDDADGPLAMAPGKTNNF